MSKDCAYVSDERDSGLVSYVTNGDKAKFVRIQAVYRPARMPRIAANDSVGKEGISQFHPAS